MNFQVNDLFKEWVSHDFNPQETDNYRFNSELLNEGITIIDGCYFFRSFAPIKGADTSDNYDRTGIECTFNKISMDNIVSAESAQEQLNYGLYFVYELAKIIGAQFGHDFNVILSYDKEYCFVRFHKIREGEKWLDEDLNNYEMEAILKILT